MTTGVWMGRDDAKPVPGLQGGTAPARAVAQFMKVAVAKRPAQERRMPPDLVPWGDDYVYPESLDGPCTVEPHTFIQSLFECRSGIPAPGE